MQYDKPFFFPSLSEQKGRDEKRGEENRTEWNGMEWNERERKGRKGKEKKRNERNRAQHNIATKHRKARHGTSWQSSAGHGTTYSVNWIEIFSAIAKLYSEVRNAVGKKVQSIWKGRNSERKLFFSIYFIDFVFLVWQRNKTKLKIKYFQPQSKS